MKLLWNNALLFAHKNPFTFCVLSILLFTVLTLFFSINATGYVTLFGLNFDDYMILAFLSAHLAIIAEYYTMEYIVINDIVDSSELKK